MSEIKEQILSTSLDLFLSHGFKSVTMDEIATKLGMSKKTLYTYYKNKGQLVEESSLFKCHYVCDGIDRIVESTTENPIEELYSIKKFLIKELKGDESSPMFQLQKYYPEVYKKLTEVQFTHIDTCVRNNVLKGIEQGLYRDNINVGFIARIYFIGMQGIKNLSIFPTEEYPSNELFEEYLEYHLRGIVTPQGRKILNKITNSNHD